MWLLPPSIVFPILLSSIVECLPLFYEPLMLIKPSFYSYLWRELRVIIENL
jgi:hypothetical protein